MRPPEISLSNEFTASDSHPDKKELEFTREVLGAEVAPITEQFLETFYSSAEFWNALEAAWQKVNKHRGDEFGFGILKDAQSDLTWLTKTQGGKFSTSTDLGQAIERLRNQVTRRNREPFIFGTLHFHPDLNADPLIFPSGLSGDLSESAMDRESNQVRTGYDVPLTEMIAARKNDGTLKMLVYQEPLTYQPRAFTALWEELGASLREEMINNQKEALELLRHYGYKVEILESTKSDFTKEVLERLKSFAFTPKWIRQAA